MATINGSAGNDTLAGTSGDDTINALEGNDIILGGSGGDDVVHGGAGFDSIEYRTAATSGLIVNYAAATITGGGSGTITFTSIERVVAGNFNDVLDGTAGGQNLTGQAGNDTLWGAAGVDTLWGGSGSDAFIFRETGSANADGIRDFSSASDKLWLDRSAMAALGVNGNFAAGDARFAANSTGTAQDASDRVIFQTGTGQVWYDADGSGAGARQLIATLQSGATLAATNIVVVGDSAPGVVTGTEGDDTLVGSDSGDDTIDGLGGNDVLIGNNGADSLRGGDGNDTLFAGEGAGSDLTEDFAVDTLDGGLGDDVYHVDGDDGDVILADPGGIDTVIAWNSDWTLGSGLENLDLADDRGVSSDGTGNELDNRISGASEGGTLLGLGGNDTLIVNIVQNSATARGGEGDDTIFGSSWDSILQHLFGDDGNDLLVSAGGGGSLTGGAGADIFFFNSLRDTSFDPHHEVTDFVSASDTIRLDAIVMPALGASGRFAAGDARFAANSSGSAQDSSDRVIYNIATGELWYDGDGSAAGEALLIASLSGAPSLAATDIEVVNGSASSGQVINGTAGNDTLSGTSGNDTINGLGGNDTINALDGNDSLDGGSGVDSMDGGLGDDTYVVTAGDVLADSGGTDTVQTSISWSLGTAFENLTMTGTGNITMQGNNLNNLIIGNAGNNTFNARAGDDTILAGGGNDRIDMFGNGFASYGNEVVDGGAGIDNMDFSGYAKSGIVVNLATGQVTGGGDAGSGTVAVSNVETVITGAFNDRFTGDSGANTFDGRGGSDTLSGGAGNDTLTGGTGADFFVFENAPGATNVERVTDFASASDTIRLDAIVMPALGASGRFAAGDARFAANSSGSAQDSSDRVIYNIATGELWYDGDGSAAGEAVLIAALGGAPSLAATDIEVVNGSASSGQMINGTAGNDSIVGTTGDDTIAGLAGDDTLDGSGGSDRLEGGDGDDLLFDDDLDIDTLNGGLGNDTYDLFNRDDPGRSVLLDAGGIDTVISRDDFYVLPDGFENLVVEGALGGEGNALDNRIVAGEPIFSGVGGGRELDGADGDDTLIGSRSEDEFWFSAGSGSYGNDSVDGDDGFDMLHFDDARSAVVADMQAGMASGGGNGGSGSVTFTHIVGIVGGAFGDHLTGHNGILVFDVESGSHVTGATLMGLGGDDTLLGGNHHDFLAGGEGDDRIAGGAGIDSIWGDAGNDAFIFNVTPAGGNRDDIGDFGTGSDQLHFDNTVYTSLGAAGAFSADDARFAANATGTAQDASDRLIYNTTNGALFYDADGSGAEEAQLVTFLQGPSALTATDIVVFGDGGNTIVGTEGDDTLVGTPGNDTIDGLAGNDSLVGGDGADQMIGGDGNDTLQGFYIPDLSGSQDEPDTLDGGLGNDEFWVDHVNDVISDSGGIDTVHVADMDWTLAAGFENLTIHNDVSEEFYNAIGNELNNVIETTWNGSRLEGRGGDDTLTSYGAWTQSVLLGGDGNDSLAGWGTLDGGAGVDTMTGSLDDDTYVVTAGDILADSGGTDTVQTDITWSLGAAFENLTMTGTGNITMQGNNLNNLIIGNAGNNTFNARAGDDTILAGAGNDRIDMFGNGFASYGNEVVDGGAGFDNMDFSGYAKTGIVVNLATGQVTGGGDGGSGTVAVSNVETVITGAFNDRFTGNSGANTFDGRGGNDTLSGGDGNDTLTGGTGNDFFVFDTAPGSGNVERITDFSSAPDQLQFENAIFTAIGAAGTFAAGDGRFWSAAGATSGHDANDRVVYNTSTGSLYYDADGSGGGGSQLIATFQGNPAMAATDITVI